ncbi:isoprenylcysteine carboxylmethyltransferase family protein [Phenylobacterium sp.]|jgi:protein-S-isoprenylcysteine O-methyltransferase Ste14|uniref:methyltransferase family protein n=1 Tax=Phenylobacterium sp. TaxID=1871053 RepID=UPI002F91D64C
MQILAALRAAMSLVIGLAILLLVPAGLVPGGTWQWPRAWIFIAVAGALVLASTVAIAIWRPASFAVRQKPVVAEREKKQPLVDRIGVPIYLAYVLAWLAFIPADVFYLQLLPPPGPIAVTAGVVMTLLGIALGQLAVAENQFAAPTIHDQSAENQRVVDTGVYAVVRHPIYTGNLLMFIGMALWLGSYAAVIGVSAMFVATLARTFIEERWLRDNLTGYEDYARRVRSRLIPFLV